MLPLPVLQTKILKELIKKLVAKLLQKIAILLCSCFALIVRLIQYFYTALAICCCNGILLVCTRAREEKFVARLKIDTERKESKRLKASVADLLFIQKSKKAFIKAIFRFTFKQDLLRFSFLKRQLQKNVTRCVARQCCLKAHLFLAFRYINDLIGQNTQNTLGRFLRKDRD